MSTLHYAVYLASDPDPVAGADLLYGSTWSTAYAVQIYSEPAPSSDQTDYVAPTASGLAPGTYKYAVADESDWSFIGFGVAAAQAVNAAPVITSDGGGPTAAVNAAENQTAVTTVVATAGASVTYSITGGADSGLFAIDSSSGVLTFISAPDYETPTDANTDGVYEVTVQASDGVDTDSQSISVTVTDVFENAAPTITSNGGGATASINVIEGSTAVTTVAATDADVGDTLTYSISGGADSALFSIGSSSGALTFNTAPDYDAPTDFDADNLYEVTVQVSDGTDTDTQVISITVYPETNGMLRNLVDADWQFFDTPYVGMLGSDIPQSGESGASPLANDTGKNSSSQYRLKVTSFPATGSLLMDSHGVSGTFTPASNGTETANYTVYEDGESIGTGTITFVSGNPEITGGLAAQSARMSGFIASGVVVISGIARFASQSARIGGAISVTQQEWTDINDDQSIWTDL